MARIGIIILLCLSLIAAIALVSAQTTDSDVKEVILPNQTIGQMLNLAVTEIEQPLCDTSFNCTTLQHRICVNRKCGCKPNYAWKNGECHPEDCTNSPQMCSQQDPNRRCESFRLAPFQYSHCVCREGWIEDPLTRICRHQCSSDMSHMCEKFDTNSLCNVYRCQCKANYRRNVITGMCESFVCEHDSQCWTEGDRYRSCINGTCACTYEEDPITQRCLINLTSLFKIRYYYSWRTERILLATIFIVPIVFFYYLRNFRKAKSTIVSFRAPRPGEQFYSHQTAISIQSPKFMTASSGQQDGVESTVVKKVDVSPTRADPSGNCKSIKYERFE